MKKLTDTGVTEDITNRINKLTPSSGANWGKMNVTQMLVHCRVPLENALGTQKHSRSFIGLLFGGIAKKGVLKDEPFKHGLPTDKRFVNQPSGNFEEERKNLTEAVNKFAAVSAEEKTHDLHPFFGKMTPEEWNILMYKHLDHHLRQFGA